LADPEAVLVVDPSGFPKKGDHSCGVARQWCGRLGKVDNCQVGVFLAYVTARGYAPLDHRLYLPQDWAADRKRRQKCQVPKEVTFQESWRIGLDLIERAGADLPWGWVAGDDAFGRVTAFRAALRQRHWRYVLDVPANTLIRDLEEPPAPGRRRPPWRRVDVWAKAQPPSRWHKVERGDGAKGPKRVWALEARVQTKDEGGRVGPEERVVVIRTIDGAARTWYTVSNAPAEVPLARVARVQGYRHGIEEVLPAGKGEVGLGQYEVRSWVGWHHHMTLSLLALWFLILEKGRVGKKNPSVDGAADAGGVRPAVAARAAEPGADRRGSQPGLTAHGRSADLPLVHRHQEVSPAAGAARRIKRLQ